MQEPELFCRVLCDLLEFLNCNILVGFEFHLRNIIIPDNTIEDDNGTLKLWHYEGEDSAMGIAWAEAIRVFEEETGATVEFEQKAFEQIQKTAGMVLSSDEGPDIMEYN